MKFTLYFSTLLLFCSCSQNISRLEEKINNLNAQITRMESEISLLKFEKEWKESVTLHAGETKYNLVASDVGTFAASMSRIEPYANGVRIRLSMGNLTAANINGLSFTASYGSLDERGYPDLLDAKEKEVTFDRQIRTGSWNETIIELPNISSNKFGFVQLKNIRHRGMSLSIR